MPTEAFEELLAGSTRGVLTTIKSDGRPQLSNILYTYDSATRTARVSTTAGRAKTANLRRDPRASLYVTSDDFWTYLVAEGTAELTPVAADPHDATVAELVEVYRALSGEHDDWDDYRRAMVRDRRLVVRLRVERIIGAGGS